MVRGVFFRSHVKKPDQRPPGRKPALEVLEDCCLLSFSNEPLTLLACVGGAAIATDVVGPAGGQIGCQLGAALQDFLSHGLSPYEGTPPLGNFYPPAGPGSFG